MTKTQALDPIVLTVAADPRLARLVRMTAANVAALSSMSVDRVEDLRMAAEEAFIFACSVDAGECVSLTFTVDDEHVALDVDLGEGAVADPEPDSPAAYAGLILTAVCDAFEKTDAPARLHLEFKADV